MSDKETNLKEKLRQALASTIRVISDDLEINKKIKIIKVQINLIFLS
jgi:cobaltochelatase CobT